MDFLIFDIRAMRTVLQCYDLAIARAHMAGRPAHVVCAVADTPWDWYNPPALAAILNGVIRYEKISHPTR